ncbi:MAG: chromosome segregation protein SMC [Armatimonadota bacterium]
MRAGRSSSPGRTAGRLSRSPTGGRRCSVRTSSCARPKAGHSAAPSHSRPAAGAEHVYLKSLQMRGFKSFADYTELEFGRGLTAIVGPNGVGKSNIADAILWVLGEQSNRAIRAQTSQDVIFAGAEKRSPLGMAEVRLLLDNADQQLPVDFTEVEVSRRLYRSGESEYAINGATCRLRDVHDLFVDTGVGQAAYSLVGQGEIEAILSVRSEDRRELMEEVAGIGKYRRRRKEAQRKLEATEANARRISDIIYELASQREPLERQAEKARRYRELDGALRGLELKLLALDLRERRDRLGKLAHTQQLARADAQGTRARLNTIEVELEKVGAELHKLEGELAHAREQAREAERAAESTERSHAVTGEKLRAARERRAELPSAEQASARIEQLRAQLEHLQAEQGAVLEQAERLAAEIEAGRRELAESERRRQEAEGALAALAAQRQERLHEAQGLAREAEAMASLQEELRERVERLEGQAAAMRVQVDEARAAREAAQRRRDAVAARVEKARARLAELSERHDFLTRTLREHRTKRGVLAGAATAAETRLALLSELESEHEGYEDAVRAVLAAAAEGALEGVRGVVGDLIEVAARHEAAIEAALGERVQWVVVDTQEQAVAAVRFLEREGLGRATFLPLMSVSSLAPRSTIISGEGCLGPATKFVRAAADVRQMVDFLLGDCLVMRDLDAALRCLQRAGYQCRAVTLEGHVIERGGAVRGGGEREDVGQIFSRRREAERVRGELGLMSRALATMWRFEERFERELDALAGQVGTATAAVADARAELSEIERDLVHSHEQAAAAEAAIEEIGTEIAELNKRLAATAARRDELAASAEGARTHAAEIGAELEAARAGCLPASEVEERRRALVAAEVACAEAREKVRSLTELARRTEQELERAREEAAATEETRRQLDERISVLEAELEVSAAALQHERAQAEAVREQVGQRSAAVESLRAKAEELGAVARKLRRLLESQQEQVQSTEVALTREQAQLESIRERLADVYGVDPDEALAQLGDEELSRHSLARQVNALKGEIRALGHVNLSAIDECERLSAREEFLSRQREDLEQARRDLLAIIDEIDAAAEREFVATFREIARAFEETFTTLFGGGTTDLYLSDPDNPLESGVEVFAQPPGKRPKHLSLLSGGERAMTALALLFAMLKVKPSPFCVLDEIDAALDATNTERFVALLQQFAQRSQFIIITHNPRTMEAVDLLHGITMQEAGVSQRISVELRDAQEEGRRQQERERAAAREGRAEVPGGGQ